MVCDVWPQTDRGRRRPRCRATSHSATVALGPDPYLDSDARWLAILQPVFPNPHHFASDLSRSSDLIVLDPIEPVAQGSRYRSAENAMAGSLVIGAASCGATIGILTGGTIPTIAPPFSMWKV